MASAAVWDFASCMGTLAAAWGPRQLHGDLGSCMGSQQLCSRLAVHGTPVTVSIAVAFAVCTTLKRDHSSCLRDSVAENPTKLDTKTFPKVVVAYTLKAMQLGSLVARQQFPRLLQLLELYPQTVDDFSKKVRKLPPLGILQIWTSCVLLLFVL